METDVIQVGWVAGKRSSGTQTDKELVGGDRSAQKHHVSVLPWKTMQLLWSEPCLIERSYRTPALWPVGFSLYLFMYIIMIIYT